MVIVIHRLNRISDLTHLPDVYGAEIDIRADGSQLILNHDPFKGGDDFDDWLSQYHHGLLVLNIKEAGIEEEVLRRIRAHGVARYFLLDVEFPYLYRASRTGERAIAVRYSEDESIDTARKYAGKVDWLWMDVNTCLPINDAVLPILRQFKVCLVCPERWGRPEDIASYRSQMAGLGFTPDAVMTSSRYALQWRG